MTNNSKTLFTHYSRALQQHLDRGSPVTLRAAAHLATRSNALGVGVTALYRCHGRTMAPMLASGNAAYDQKVGRTHAFFSEVLRAMAQTRAGDGGDGQAKREQAALSAKALKLTAQNLLLSRDNARRALLQSKLSASLQTSNARHKLLLTQAQVAQAQLRRLSHNILSVQEEERKEISRELHDEIAQTLAGIGVHLAALKDAASVNTHVLRQKIGRTQRFVERSVKIVHRFARQLRPTLLDDLGLIPALQSHLKTYIQRTGLAVVFKSTKAVERLNSTRRTVIYRVAQEALTNIARHAHASRVVLTIGQAPNGITMEIRDNGRAFAVEKVLQATRNRHLGLIGMRERVEMTGGKFSIESARGRGTSVRAVVPLNGDRTA
jgi:signal transduction histidine kinase